MNRFLYILVFLSLCTTGRATHNRAGQILYRHVSGYTYEFTVTVFYYTLSPATEQRIASGLPVTWGDNYESTVPCIESEIELLPDDYTKCVFRERHTFPGPGIYSIVMADPNRNVGVRNISYSDNVVFSLKTIFRIDPNFAANNAPELLTYPIDRAALGQVFVHNPSAYDIDGDSLSYELAVCTRERGVEIENYSYPEASDSLAVNAVTGDLVWASPVAVGFYNVAMRINEWRRGVKIGSIARDMQIEVVDSKNRPPVLPEFPPVCVEAGTKVSLSVHVTDPDNDSIVLTATGGPFQVTNGAELDIAEARRGYTDAVFVWQTGVEHVRKQPYAVLFKAEDQNPEVKLVSFAGFNITVLAPKVKNLTAAAGKKSIMLHWDPTECPYAAGYEIYRSIGNNTFDIDSCAGGIPAGSGYERIAAVSGIAGTDYEDTNDGKGLSPGINYCYRVVVYFSDGARGFPSEESCAVLLGGTPPIILADAETIDAVNGKINVAWLQKPIEEKLVGKNGPFEYRLYYTNDPDANNWHELERKQWDDTTYIHENIDTETVYPYYYKVELWDTDPAAGAVLVDDFETASTLYPVLQPSDRSAVITFGRYVPWLNTEYEIYRCLRTGADMCTPEELIGRTNRETYTDTGLKNGLTYCYRIQSFGYRNTDVGIFNNQNRSHIACVTPYDNVPPCTPELSGTSICEESRNVLDWTAYDPACPTDVEKYRIYFSVDNKTYVKVDSVPDRDIRTWSHRGAMKGCYYITAVDSAGNASAGSNTVCLDQCGAYALPNVFTPNGDNINDIFKSYNPGGVNKVDMKIYNRWGKLVFKTSDAGINWDGRDIDGKKFAPTGVYYYTCDVYEERLTGSQTVSLSGFIHLYYGEEAQPYTPPIE